MRVVTPGDVIFYYPGLCSQSRVFLDMDSRRGGVGGAGSRAEVFQRRRGCEMHKSELWVVGSVARGGWLDSLLQAFLTSCLTDSSPGLVKSQDFKKETLE